MLKLAIRLNCKTCFLSYLDQNLSDIYIENIRLILLVFFGST